MTTVRPSEDAAALAHRMSHAQVTRVVVTRSDGTLVGLFFASDLPSAPRHDEERTDGPGEGIGAGAPAPAPSCLHVG